MSKCRMMIFNPSFQAKKDISKKKKEDKAKRLYNKLNNNKDK